MSQIRAIQDEKFLGRPNQSKSPMRSRDPEIASAGFDLKSNDLGSSNYSALRSPNKDKWGDLAAIASA